MNRTNSARLGKVGQLDDGRYIVSYERRVQASIEKVWHAISDPKALSQWFPEVRLDARDGGAFSIHFTGENCEGPADVQGEVTEFTPPHVLHFGSMRFELKAEADGGCTIYFSDVLQFERGRTPMEVTDSVLAGWHQFMDRIETYLQGGAIDFNAEEVDYRAIAVEGRELIPD